MKLKTLLVALVALLLSLPAAAQQRAAAEVFHRVTEAGVEVAIAIDIDASWHLYGESLGPADAIGTPTTVELSAIGLEFDGVRFPKPHRSPMPYGAEGKPTWAWTHSDRTVLYAFGVFEDGVPEADTEFDLFIEMRGQTCSDVTGSCVLYEEDLESTLGGPDELFEAFPADMIPAVAKVVPPAELEKTKPFDTQSYGDSYGGAERHAAATLQHRIVGNTIEAVVSVQLDPHWHLYGETVGGPGAIGKPTVVSLDVPGVTWEAPRFPAAEKEAQDAGLPDGLTWVWMYKTDFDVLVRGTFEGAAPTDVRATVDGLTCSDETGTCIDFSQDVMSTGVTRAAAFAGFAKAGAVTPSAVSGKPAPDSARSVAPKKKSKGLWQFVLLCIGGGLFTLLMPCTYPMIPITISFFTKQAEKNGKPPIELSLAYGIGIILMFELIGFVVGPVIITFAQHWLTNAIIGLVFLYFALVLLGALTLEPPRFLMKVAGGASQKGGLLGVFLMGATLVVTSFTCTAPILGSILTAGATGAASTGGAEGVDILRMALGMGAFGLTMAVPFVVLSLVPGKLSGLPSSGEWMNTLKVTLGFVELAAAFKFFSNWDMAKQSGVLPDELLLLVWIVTLGVAAAYLFGFIKLTSSTSDRISPVRALFGTSFLLLVGYFTLLLFGYPRGEVMTAFLPGYSNGSVFGAATLGSGNGGDGTHTSSHEIFVDDYDGALARARGEGKLLLVNLTGFT